MDVKEAAEVLEGCRTDVETFLEGFVDRKCATVPDDPVMLDALRHLRPMLRGGKRLRSQLCHAGSVAFGETGGPARRPHSIVVRLGTSLELFHSFALIHDDVMDGSDLRRGRPSLHRALERSYQDHAAATRLGVNTALLLGDLVLCWSTELAHAAADDAPWPEPVHQALRAMRFETMVGQYHDLHEAGSMSTDHRRALTTSRLKTAAYTACRPLQMGALLSASKDRVRDATRFGADFGIPLGEAYQLRNDLAGAFEDPDSDTNWTGHEDLRSGTHTVLMATALRLAGPAQHWRLRALVGATDLDADGIRAIQRIMEDVGARHAVEELVAERRARACSVLADSPITDEGRKLLCHLLDEAL